MTIEQYIEHKKKLCNSVCSYIEQPLEDMLAEAEEAKKRGLLLSKDNAFAILMSDEF